MPTEVLTLTFEGYLEIVFNIIATSKVVRSMELLISSMFKRELEVVSVFRSVTGFGLLLHQQLLFSR
ncbi:MAG: hypothetical protein JW915_19015 [Chitinispirillaceae bacterium]|nr:hypothetical protein [Chitinispirillaceae bacterium]